MFFATPEGRGSWSGVFNRMVPSMSKVGVSRWALA